ncbi:MAG: undecaprenyl-diphosphate phosphatase [Lachnospiraceae bacterium]|nr:undecaprenyl-diphosphate phosphatase [Lachnospiraceae bacterium]
MLELLKAVLFSIVEGITEWLPVSSTGHMIILDEFIRLDCTPEFMEMFLVVIQLGAIMAVVLLFWNKIFPFQFKDKSKPVIEQDKMMLWLKIIAACIPAAVVGILFDSVFEELFYHAIPVALALIVFGVAFIVIERRNKGKKAKVTSLDEITFQTALMIGVFQLIAAVFPGTSRSGATIVGALLIGVSRSVAAEFTFFLAIPVMFGASLLKLVKFGFSFTGSELGILLVGMIVSFAVSVVVIKFLMDYIKKHDFQVFGWYRIALGAVVIALGMCGVITV